MFQCKRVYDPIDPRDGQRFLIDGLWPRGISKASLEMAAWIKDVAPGAALRKWFNHEPGKWNQFRRRYFAELDAKPETWAPLIQATKQGPVTLLYSASDTAHNNAVALTEYLEAKARQRL
jgi:uncharacterized protein YeaO (DUF488 family)